MRTHAPRRSRGRGFTCILSYKWEIISDEILAASLLCERVQKQEAERYDTVSDRLPNTDHRHRTAHGQAHKDLAG